MGRGRPAPRGDAPGLPHLPAHPHAPLSPSSLPWSKTTTDGRSGAWSWRKGPKSQGREVVQQQRESSDFQRRDTGCNSARGLVPLPPRLSPSRGSPGVLFGFAGLLWRRRLVPACPCLPREQERWLLRERQDRGIFVPPRGGKNNKTKKNRLWFALYSFRMLVQHRSQVAKLGFADWCHGASLHAQAPATGGHGHSARHENLPLPLPSGSFSLPLEGENASTYILGTYSISSCSTASPICVPVPHGAWLVPKHGGRE